MSEDASRTVVVLVHPGTSPRRSAEILRWLRWLLPTALLVVAPAAVPLGDAYDVITIDADRIESGPLSLANAIARDREVRSLQSNVAEDDPGVESGDREGDERDLDEDDRTRMT